MLELARGLLAHGCRVTIAVHDHDPATDLARIDRDVEVRAVRHGVVEPLLGQRDVWRRQFRGMPAVARLVPDADVVNAHEWPALRAGSILRRRRAVPLVWTRNDETMFERGLFPDESHLHPGSPTSRARHVLYNLSDVVDARRADAIVVLDNRNAANVQRAFRRQAVVVRSGPTPHFFAPIDRNEARTALGVAPGERLVAAFGIMFRHRRFEDLIDAVAQLDGALPVRTRIVGFDGYEPHYADALAARITELGVGDRVELVRESLTDAELRRLYTAADVFVFPNDRQTWGLAPLEALAHGTPAVVSRGAGVHEVLEGRPGVWTVPPGRPDRIAEALRAAVDARDSVAPTREWIRDELSPERYAEGVLRVFESVVARR